MSERAKTECKDLDGHHLHLCQSKKKGLAQRASVSDNGPGYICHNCNEIANRAEELCNPSLLIRRP
jgi:hypothetical protein